MHGCCDVLHRSLGERRVWDVFISWSEQGVEIPEEMVQVEEACLIRAEGGVSY